MLEELKEANNYIIDKINKVRTDDLSDLEKYALDNNVPIVAKEVAEYIKFLLKTNKIKNVLEIGTAIGYSGIIIANEIKKNDGILYTIEIDSDRYKEAVSNFEKYGIRNVVAINGDALDEIKKIKENFDFIFIDASKGQYFSFFNDSYKLLNKNGIIFIDNLLFRGYVYKEYPKRFKTIVKRLDSFIEYLYKLEKDDFVLLPFGDGVGLLKKA